ncbi:TPA: hypothetical protein EYP66_15945 [Candidatus Poribacteria bacterium]|nr:hypothetical protein [Candidatus Poribacteria bacterium]
MDVYIIYIIAAIGFASAIYLLIYAWRHPPEQRINRRTDINGKRSIQAELKELQRKYDVVATELTEMKNAFAELKNKLSKNGLI